MMRLSFSGAALFLMGATALAGNDLKADLEAIAERTVRAWTQDTRVLSAVHAQNETSAGLRQTDIDSLDQSWRAQTMSGGDMIDNVLTNSLSLHLRELQATGHGQFSEIFVMDIRGLNVGQSNVTSDYWQGDEEKWQVPFTTGKPYLGEVEFDESTQTYQSQISLPIKDGGSVIGVITVGVNLQELTSRK